MILYEILFSENAKNDLIQISSYISKVLLEPILAKKTLETIKKTVLSHGIMPERHYLLSKKEIRKLKLRLINSGNFLIFYSISEKNKQVNIVRILYSKRDWIKYL